MKKRKLFGLTATVLALALTGCFGGGDDSGSTGSGETSYGADDRKHWLEDEDGNIINGSTALHTFEDYAGDANHKVVAASCGKEGTAYKKCTVCGKYLSEKTPALEHEWEDSGEPVSRDVCEKGGKIDRVCKNCGAEEKKTIAATGHDYTVADSGKTGVSILTCKNCGTVTYELDISKATGWNKSTTKWNAKTTDPSNNVVEASWDVDGVVEDGTYNIEVEGIMTYESHGERKWYNMAKAELCVGGTVEESSSASSPDKTSEDDYRYYFKADNSLVNPNVKDSWSAIGYQGQDTDGATPKFGAVCNDVPLVSVKTFSMFHGNIGFSLVVSKVRLIKIA